MRRRGIEVPIARRGTEAETHLGRHRWVVEYIISCILRFKGLGPRCDRTGAALRPLLLLAVVLADLRRLAGTKLQRRGSARRAAGAVVVVR